MIPTDFGLSNTLKPDSLSLELLNTQCGSPAYAAPELLAHKKYGSKVDVWSMYVTNSPFVCPNRIKTSSLFLPRVRNANVMSYFCLVLLSHRGVSMFAMLTGTLPFTVEPFNIKQLHHKMVNKDISDIPGDISKGQNITTLWNNNTVFDIN